MDVLPLARFTMTVSRRFAEIGLLLAVIGAAVVALTEFLRWSRANSDVGAWGIIAGALLVAIGLGLLLIGLHFGVSPYRLHK